ncbi:MAG: hypothetical protein KGZ73_01755 [Rhizobiales bacterium]|nr:hypothetical protein [Hyphomicrobiales bacterium]
MNRFSVSLILIAAVSIFSPAAGSAHDFSAPLQMTPRPQLAQQQDCPNCARLPQAECVTCNMQFGWTKQQSIGWCSRKAHCRRS